MRSVVTTVRVGAILVVSAAAACANLPDPNLRHTPGTESMPAPASVWLTADPASPSRAVTIEMTSDGGMHRTHTFPAGEPLRGSFPVSEGRYRLIGDKGACAIDIVLEPEREADVVIAVHADGCEFAELTVHRYGAVTHREPSVLVAPGSVP